VLKVKPKYRV